MYKNNDLQRNLTAAIGAVVVSLTFIGAAVGPVPATALLSAPTSVRTSAA